LISPIENEIVSLLKNGDKKAINLLYEYYADAIYGVILKVISDEEIAQDALQERFVKIYKNTKKYDQNNKQIFTLL